MDGCQRSAVRLLPERADHASRCAAQGKAQTHRQGNRRFDAGQHLPLRNIRPNPKRHQVGRGGESMSTVKVMERRAFLKYTFGAGALILGTHVETWASDADKASFHPSVFLGIQPTGEVIIVAHRSEMGTGSKSTLPMVVADELDADWKRVRVEQAIGDEKYGSQN